MVGLETAKSAVRAVLNVAEVDFTLDPVFPQLFVATFRSKELRDRASKVSVPGGQLGPSEVATPMAPVEVPPEEEPPSVATAVPTVEVPLVEALPPIEMPVVEVLAPLSATDDTPQDSLRLGRPLRLPHR
jgi:hypothetical protein